MARRAQNPLTVCASVKINPPFLYLHKVKKVRKQHIKYEKYTIKKLGPLFGKGTTCERLKKDPQPVQKGKKPHKGNKSKKWFHPNLGQVPAILVIARHLGTLRRTLETEQRAAIQVEKRRVGLGRRCLRPHNVKMHELRPLLR